MSTLRPVSTPSSWALATTPPTTGDPPEHWHLRLYVAGQSPKSLKAYANLIRLCEEHLEARSDVEIVDLVENPQLAAGDEIIDIPTLVRRLPEPVRKIIGDLSPRRGHRWTRAAAVIRSCL